MALGSKFAHLWMENGSPGSSLEEGSNDGSKAEDSLKVTMDFLRSMDQESLDYLRRDCDTSDLFASFGYDTSFGAVSSAADTTPSPGRRKVPSSVADRAFVATSTPSWQQSENASGGSPSFGRHASSEGSSLSLSGHVNCSPFVQTNGGSDLCRNYSPRKSEGVAHGHGAMGGPPALQLGGLSVDMAPVTNGHGYDKYAPGSLTGLEGPGPMLTSSPVSNSSSSDTDNSAFNHTMNHLGTLGTYSALTQTLTYIAAQLAEFGQDQGDSSPRSPWGSRNNGFGHLSPETRQKYIRLLRNIQDTLMTAVDMDGSQRSQMLELSCTLQKQLLYQAVGDEGPKNAFGGGGMAHDMANESQVQAAKFLRENPGFMPQTPFVWRGVLPHRDYQNAVFSCKVFLGGLPYDMTEQGMIQAFKPFGNVKVEWPGKEINPLQHKGYAYIIFENEKQVKIMLQHCTVDYLQNGKWFCKMSSRRVRMKDVEVIPWALSDSNFALRPSSKLEPRLTIFVGALHGMLNAEGLAVVMESLFGGVVHTGIDTDKNRYPIGSGRVSFDNFQSYFTAINGAFVEIKSSKFSKVVQLDPYLDDANCSQCSLQQAPYFCRSLSCFRYYCRTCFELAHASEALRSHRPLMRNPNKKSQTSGFSSPSSFKTNYRFN